MPIKLEMQIRRDWTLLASQQSGNAARYISARNSVAPIYQFDLDLDLDLDPDLDLDISPRPGVYISWNFSRAYISVGAGLNSVVGAGWVGDLKL